MAVVPGAKSSNTTKKRDILQAEVQEFRKCEAILADRFPEVIAEAQLLADIVIDPNGSDVDKVWSILWGKPLFANARVPVAERWCEALSFHMDGAWKLWGEPSHFLISKTGAGIQRSSFKVKGDAAEEILRTGIALHRLHAIQGAARATRHRAAVSDRPFQDLMGLELSEAVKLLRGEFGAGWGPITTLHFLTDLGLAVKPDLHLMRAMRYFSGQALMAGGKVASFSEAIEANNAVKQLRTELEMDPSSANMRYLDKVLMEISRQGII